MQEYVLGLMFDPSLSKIALIKKESPPWQAGYLNGIGGKVNPGEQPLLAMRREFEEETGVHQKEWEHTITLEKEGEFVLWVYRCVSEKIEDMITQKEEVGVYEVDEIPKLKVIANLKWLVPMQLDLHLQMPTRLWER